MESHLKWRLENLFSRKKSFTQFSPNTYYRRYPTSLSLAPLRTLRLYPPIWPPSSTLAFRSSAVSSSSTTCWTPSSSDCLCGAWPISDHGSTLSPWSYLPGLEHSPSPRPTSWIRYPSPPPLINCPPLLILNITWI